MTKTSWTDQFRNNILKVNRSKDPDRYKDNVFHISEIVMCPSRAYYVRKLGVRPEMNGKMLAGTLVHAQIPKIVKGIKDFKDAKYEVEVYTSQGQYALKGHCDAITHDRVWEFKFTGGDMRKYGASPHHLMQVNAYAWMLDRPSFSIVTINSTTLEVQRHDGQVSAFGYDYLVAKAGEVYKALQDNEPPTGPSYAWECAYCQNEIRNKCKQYTKGDNNR